MESLTRTLIAQHRVAEGLAQVVQNALGRGDRKVVQEATARLAEALLAHLEVEDSKLYPALIEAARARGDERTAQVALEFSRSMGSISTYLRKFFARYKHGEVDLARFEGDWKSVQSALKARITAEELSLYPLYEKLGLRPVTLVPVASRAVGG